MGKPTGFIEYQRLAEASEPVASRLKHYREFVRTLSDEEASLQGARCMDCGIPFCNTGCPVNNIIPDWNDLVYRGNWQQALAILHSTNNFPEFTGRICPAPCEAACTLNINTDAVGIKSIEHAIADKGWQQGWIVPQPPARKTGKKVAIVGSGPAGLAAAQQLARAGHAVAVFEKSDRIGGLLRYGIPDFKLEKSHIDRRVEQMQAEGVEFRVSQEVGGSGPGAVPAARLLADFDAVIVAGGAEAPRDLPVPGRDLEGVHFAMEFLPQQNRLNAGDRLPAQITATGKRVVVIGGGDTGSDCVGTSNRQGALSVTQFEVMPQPPEQEDKTLTWPYWPMKLRTSSSHEEGCARDFAVSTTQFLGEGGKLKALRVARVEWSGGRMAEIPGSESEIAADLVLLAMGFVSPRRQGLLEQLAVELDARGNVRATTDGEGCYATSIAKVFAAGDMRRGQSLVVWAIREGRQCAREVDAFLMGRSDLPR
ncbi:MAG: Glutamate synthase [NADPH] small chain [Candidatus Accumulibacter sp. BA-94]|uniref:glutamate synthase subunit beta n=1 Tax=Accumulibacter sp. TaxID=2053492 RepID=UPI0004476F07|nr:glutamate synthase subunit beta [Accumulibacter sp.]EXI85670.1 MAG: Glutamate synthase [NADPH] small chain [Candidatus Accumulibacter sp. BA-94]HRD88441.1 glutamate synthase subunit beta [Accumulibacter sp.]